MSDDQPIIDQDVLAELRASVSGDEAFVTDLAQTYLAEGGDYLAQMEQAATAGDAAAVVRPAHTLKSSSAALGAARMSSICRDIEHAAREGRADGLAEAVAEARRTWDETVAQMRSAGLAG